MGKHMISKRAICPFYKHETSQVIYCEGIREGSVLHLAFASKTDAKDYKEDFCHTNCWRGCVIAQMLGDYADE